MALTKDDLNKIAALLHPLDERSQALEAHIDAGFGRLFQAIDAFHKTLAAHDEQQLAARDRVTELEGRVKKLERQLAAS